MKKRQKKTIRATIVVSIVSLIGVGSYLISKEFTHIENNQNVKLENKLIIGTYKESQTTNGKTSFNKLYVEIVNNGDVVEKFTYETNDKHLIEDSNYENCVFLDLTETMEKYIDNLGIYFWSLSAPSKNYISVRTEFLIGGFLSEKVKIIDSGLYLVNIPSKTGVVPQVEHAYIYQNNKIGW